MFRKIFLWLLAIGFIWFVISRFTEIEDLARTLHRGRLEWVATAAALQILLYISYTLVYHLALSTVEVNSRLFQLLPLTFAAVFMNVAVPSGGASGSALFIDDAARRGESPARAAAGLFLALIAEYSTFTVALLFGLGYLFKYHDLQIYQVIAAALMLTLIVGLCGLLLSGLWARDHLFKLMSQFQHLANRFVERLKLRRILRDNWASQSADELADAAQAITVHPDRLAKTMLAAVALHLINLTTLLALFIAFNQPTSFGILVAGYSMAFLFLIVSITPMGVGIVEGIMTLVLTSLGVPGEKALVISLSYRGLTFWIPFAIGFFMMRRLKAFTPTPHQRANIG
jgi:glycosyltransferase 2 family protein